MKNVFALLVAFAVAVSFAGCEKEKKDDVKKGGDETKKVNKGGGHDHGHAHGPHGQPMFEMHDLELHGEMLEDLIGEPEFVSRTRVDAS